MKFTEIKAELEKGLKTFQVFEHAAEMVTKLADLDKECKALENTIQSLKADETAAANKVTEQQVILVKERQAVEKLKLDTELACQAKLKDADARKEDIIDKTNKQRDDLLKLTKETILKEKAAEAGTIEKLRTERIALEDAVKVKGKELDDTSKLLATLKEEVESIKAAKEALTNLLKGV